MESDMSELDAIHAFCAMCIIVVMVAFLLLPDAFGEQIENWAYALVDGEFRPRAAEKTEKAE
jgi:hypothetical protein